MIAGFKCSYCDRFFFEAEEAMRHELICSHNTEVKSCKTCTSNTGSELCRMHIKVASFDKRKGCEWYFGKDI